MREVRRPTLNGLSTALVGTVLVFTACSPAATTSTAPSASPPPASSAAPSASVAPSPTANAAFDELVAAAKTEGKVVFAGQGDATFRDKVSAAFQQKYGIEVEYLEGTRDLAARLVSEYAAGVYSVDVVNDGMGTMSSVYAATGEVKDGVMGMLAPMKDSLLLPEVIDPTKYYLKKLWFADPEGKYAWRMVIQTSHALTVNAKVFDPAAIKSWNDLLKPEYKGKIVATDPAGFGAALSGAALMIRDLGEDYFKKLYVDQKVFICDDSRQCADQIARGGYGIALYLDEEDVDSLNKDGFNIVQPPDPPEIAASVTAGAAILGLASKGPHPNAAKLFVNWLLSKEGQQLWQDTRFEPSVRNDLEMRADYPDWLKRRFVDQNATYFDGESWEFTTEVRTKTRETVGKILGN